MKWFISAVVVIIIAAGLWLLRAPISSIFHHSQTPPSTQTTTNTAPPQELSYTNTVMGVSFIYPAGYTLNPTWKNTTVVPTKPISGIQLTIPASMATGTNLSPDTYISIEQLPRARFCTGDIYLAANVKATDVVDNGVTYSVASSTDAAAGNRYEETVWAIKDSKPCTAVRYFVHYGVIQNYTPGAVMEFDRTSLMQSFDQIRRSLVLTAPGSPAATTTPAQ